MNPLFYTFSLIAAGERSSLYVANENGFHSHLLAGPDMRADDATLGAYACNFLVHRNDLESAFYHETPYPGNKGDNLAFMVGIEINRKPTLRLYVSGYMDKPDLFCICGGHETIRYKDLRILRSFDVPLYTLEKAMRNIDDFYNALTFMGDKVL